MVTAWRRRAIYSKVTRKERREVSRIAAAFTEDARNVGTSQCPEVRSIAAGIDSHPLRSCRRTDDWLAEGRNTRHFHAGDVLHSRAGSTSWLRTGYYPYTTR